eukprot:7087065-Pyramimonas_sp.AAC.1
MAAPHPFVLELVSAAALKPRRAPPSSVPGPHGPRQGPATASSPLFGPCWHGAGVLAAGPPKQGPTMPKYALTQNS